MPDFLIRSRFELPRLIAGQICIHACMSGTRLAAPLKALSEGYSPIAVGFLLALFAVMQVFLAIPTGRFADRHGLKKPLTLALIAACLGGVLATFYPVYPVLCLTALLTGGATGSATIILQRHVGRAARDTNELKRVFSWLGIGPAISNFLGPVTAGLMIDHFGYRSAFFLMACLPIATWFWIRSAVELPSVEVVVKGEKLKVWDLLKESMMRRLLVVNWLLSSCWDVHTFVVPLIGYERGLSASVIGAILGSFALSAALVRVILPFFSSWIKEWILITTSMGCTACIFIIYPFMHSALAMGICSVCLGLSLGSVQPMIISTLHQITPESRHGEALGLRMMSISASSVLMPFLFGATGAVVGVSAIFWTVASAVGVGTRMAWSLRPNKLKSN